ncbi:MAG: tryptophan synthase subunit alpha [Gracilibacteraceae bacterium]|jgi:tryptophan synthase alpha chain|nr:tryptophan synthase subunit alpha [Gracilibacteraceae bacterium]
MNRITEAFHRRKALIPFITGGDPDMAVTEELIYALIDAGADLEEIGLPFSDPIAEGPVIQAADERALRAGCTADKLFTLVRRVRRRTNIPLLFMTYLNPVFTYGSRRFMENCADCGVDGLITPDMPWEERGELAADSAACGVTLISMLAPTSAGRVRQIAASAEGFLYCVSSLGVTGERQEIGRAAADIIARARTVTNLPCAIGFGISTPAQAGAMAALADGVIVGSAIVRLVAENGAASVAPVREFVRGLRAAIDAGSGTAGAGLETREGEIHV